MSEGHWPVEYTGADGVKRMGCNCGGELPCPHFVPGKVTERDRFDLPWGEPYPPLDIQKAAQALARVWNDAVRRLERENGEHIFVPRFALDDCYIEMVKTLEAYDRGRTEYIKLLKREVARLIAVIPGPVVIKDREGR